MAANCMERAVHFLSRDAAKALEKNLHRQMAERPEPKSVLYYQSGRSDYSGAAQAIVASARAFTTATVLYQFCVTGDGWDEMVRDHEGWRAYRAWRAAAGE